MSDINCTLRRWKSKPLNFGESCNDKVFLVISTKSSFVCNILISGRISSQWDLEYVLANSDVL